MTKEEVQLEAFQIIAAAGDAFGNYYNALREHKFGNSLEAKQKIEEGDIKLNEAHLVHTRLIHAEVNDEELPYSLIVSHAQDHLTMALTWEKIAKLVIDY